MNRMIVMLAALALFASPAMAGSMKAYQVTGPVLDLTDDSITVQKGNEKWQIARDASAKITGDLKVGSKVTVEYRMTATSIEVKAGGKGPKK
ncbi:MAG TPA: hypothetical protein VFN94_03925 [Nitrospiria bacterium]|nr:hypothetical protein [Nitrospiria bacterium]